MKKLMIAAAVAAMGSGAFAACEEPDPVDVDVARVYQIQMNVYTTAGHARGLSGIGATQCSEGTSECLVMRGKDKTVLRGYVYVCANPCEMSDYAAFFADVRRGAIFSDAAFEWDVLNAMGSSIQDAEAAWTFEGSLDYDDPLADGSAEGGRAASYSLRGAGYGQFYNKYADGMPFFNNLAGYFAGTVDYTYDLKSKPTAATAECVCTPSMVVKCDDDTVWVEADASVAFGTWKMKFNANVTKQYLTKGEIVFPTLLKKMFKK